MICKALRVSLFKREKNLYIRIKLNLDETHSFFSQIQEFYVETLAKKMAKNSIAFSRNVER